jgi:hypothetical protein
MLTVVDFETRHAPGIIERLPTDARELLQTASNHGFTIRPGYHQPGRAWDWCFTDVQYKAKYPQYATICCRSRGAWDETQEVLHDTKKNQYVTSVHGYQQPFTPDTIVHQSPRVLDLLLVTPSGDLIVHRDSHEHLMSVLLESMRSAVSSVQASND